MINGKKIIGVCLAKIHDTFNSDFVAALHKAVKGSDYKLIVFNSVLDLYNGNDYDDGSRAVFEIMNYNALDAIVIICKDFYDKETVPSIVEKAKQHSLPIIVIHDDIDDCYCIYNDYEDSFKAVLRHVIKDHGATDTFFIAGTDTDNESEIRLGCYKQVLDEFGLPFSRDNYDYGFYWKGPTEPIVDKLCTGRKPPRAIFCANDYMAITVCDKLSEYGYKVPDDVIVTGFDGIQDAMHLSPRLTNCVENFDNLASLTLGIAEKAIKKELKPGLFSDYSEVHISESCGCTEDGADLRKDESYLYKTMKESEEHERFVYNWLDRILESRDLNHLSQSLSGYILRDSFVCLKQDFIASSMGYQGDGQKQQGDDLVIIASRGGSTSKINYRFNSSDMVPDLEEWLDEDSVFVISSVFVGASVCGYYAAKFKDVGRTSKRFNRVMRIMNAAFCAVSSRFKEKLMQRSIANAALANPISGLPNLKGITEWFDGFSAVPDSRKKTLTVSIYAIPKYKFIYENYGIDDIEEILRFVAESLKLANPGNCYISHISDDEFVIVNYFDDPNDISDTINHATSVFFGLVEGFNRNSAKGYYLEVNCGCAVVTENWEGDLATYIKLASNEMYLNRLVSGNGEVVKQTSQPKELYNAFTLLIEKNLFSYHFQPIVSAKNGEIFAYEALMRTKGGINLSPLDILATAKEYKKLYEIEKATLFNVAQRYSEEAESFGGKKVFINSIPGCFLSEEDSKELVERYGQHFSHFVLEITEQDSVSDEELRSIKRLKAVDGESQIAIDDYGSGHSNMVNLLRYSPQVIKIDRFLISSIQNDNNKQMFVKSTIEFAKLNNIMVLAEGVETLEEMQTVIELGVDLIQGYYTARPSEKPITELPERIRNEIIAENVRLSEFGGNATVYAAAAGETVDVNDIADKKYTFISITGGKVKLVGSKKRLAEVIVRIADNIEAELTLENVNMRGVMETTVRIGKGSSLKLILEGENYLLKEGIYVPPDAQLEITGSGSLEIDANRNFGVGIGANCNDAFGSIKINSTGVIKMMSVGDRTVGIGGGSPSGKPIELISGSVFVRAGGVCSVGIGAFGGGPEIIVGEKADIELSINGNDSIAMGSVNGECTCTVYGKVHTNSNGQRAVSIGSLSCESNLIDIKGGFVIAEVHSDSGVAIGTLNGGTKIKLAAGYTEMYAEGKRVFCMGSDNGTADVEILAGIVNLRFSSEIGGPTCCEKGRIMIEGGNVITGDGSAIKAQNRFGTPLVKKHIAEQFYERQIDCPEGSYTYKATKMYGTDDLFVYVPENYAE